LAAEKISKKTGDFFVAGDFSLQYFGVSETSTIAT